MGWKENGAQRANIVRLLLRMLRRVKNWFPMGRTLTEEERTYPAWTMGMTQTSMRTMTKKTQYEESDLESDGYIDPHDADTLRPCFVKESLTMMNDCKLYFSRYSSYYRAFIPVS